MPKLTQKLTLTCIKQVHILNKAHKQLGRLPRQDMQALYAALETLAAWPECRNVKRIVSSGEYRLRVGHYRALFRVEGENVIITEVKKRDEHTY